MFGGLCRQSEGFVPRGCQWHHLLNHTFLMEPQQEEPICDLLVRARHAGALDGLLALFIKLEQIEGSVGPYGVGKAPQRGTLVHGVPFGAELLAMVAASKWGQLCCFTCTAMTWPFASATGAADCVAHQKSGVSSGPPYPPPPTIISPLHNPLPPACLRRARPLVAHWLLWTSSCA